MQSRYHKVRVRGGLDFPLAGVAMAAQGASSKPEQLRIAFTGTDSRPILLKGCQALLGHPLGAVVLKALGRLIKTQTKHSTFIFIANQYRSKVAVNIARRMLVELLD
ncbi:MAG: hypothetical protein QF872_10050 [Gammaproteobacteria bacterium]|nr:hypothetical protein [Gammaproteobacteria bacterium]